MRYIITEHQYHLLLENIETTLKTLGNENLPKAKQFYINHFKRPETIAKLKSPNSASKVINNFIPKINVVVVVEPLGWVAAVDPDNFYYIQLNALGNKENVSSKEIYEVLVHEMAHSIDNYLESIGENSVTKKVSGYQKVKNNSDDKYVDSDAENYARIQRLRQILKLNPNADGSDLYDTFHEMLDKGTLKFPNSKSSMDWFNNEISIYPTTKVSNSLTSLWEFYKKMSFGNTTIPEDIAGLFAKYSVFDGKKIILFLDKIGELNNATVMKTPSNGNTGNLG